MSVQLNPQQLEACNAIDGPLLILAGAGTGKTRVLTQKIAHIIDQGLCYPDQILAVTFTNKAANEMLERIESITSAQGLWIGTFHSLATRMLRTHAEALNLSKSFTIIDVDDQWRLLRKICKELNYDEKEYNPKLLAWIIGRWKDLGLFPENLTSSDILSSSDKVAKSIYFEYQKRLTQLNALDFGDLLLYCLKLFKDFPDILAFYQDKFRYLLVDEYQDTNATQYLWLRYLSQKHKNICAVGDEDQSIYGWRGAEIRNIMKFTHDFPNAKIIRLEQNYRSTNHILSTANHLIAKNKTRFGKSLWTDIVSENKVKILQHLTDRKEAEFIANTIKTIPNSVVAILVRASSQMKTIEDIFIQNKIAYKIIGGLKFYDRLEIKNAVAYIRLAYNPNDSLAFERIINVPKRGLGPSTITQIQEYASLHQCSYFKATQIMLVNNYFKGKLYNTLTEFVRKIEIWNNLWPHFSCHEACKTILNESGYIESLESSATIESESRLENLKELLKNIAEFDHISQFLEHVSLVNDLESEEDNAVKIMTMHAAKGLEFSTVFLPGWEEGIFPSNRSNNNPDELEEERRLAYVAITRARERVYITHATSRFMYGEFKYNQPSIFVRDLTGIDSTETNYFNKTSLTAEIFTQNKFSESYSGPKAGDKVLHSVFGYGKLIGLEGDHANVAFPGIGLKRILKTYLTMA